MKTLYDKHWEADQDAKTHGDVCDNHVAITLEFATDFAHWIRYEVKNELNFSVAALLGQYQAHLSLTKSETQPQ